MSLTGSCLRRDVCERCFTGPCVEIRTRGSAGLGEAATSGRGGFGQAKPSGAFALFCCRKMKSVSAAFHSGRLGDHAVAVVPV